MKVAQNDETNPDMQPVRPPHTSNIPITQLSPSGSSVRKRETPGILSRMFSPFVGITYYRDWAHLASLLVMSCIDMHLFAWYSLFLPPLLSGRLRDRRRCYPVRLRCWRPLLLGWASRQANPPWSSRYCLLFPSTACIRVVLPFHRFDPILLHSMSLLLLLLPFPVILNA